MSKLYLPNRRRFLGQSAAALGAFTIIPASVLGNNGAPAPSDRLNLAFIGIGGQGRANLNGLSNQNVVALCDVDDERAGDAYASFPGAKKFTDYRRMLDEMDSAIDAVVVSTPDHTHAVAAMRAIKMGKHVYCEKPLAHSIWEVRQLRDAAREAGVVTQLGNQGHSSEHIRLFCEWIWDGAIGPVREVHACCSSNYSRRELIGRLQDDTPVPDTLDWDLWLGPVAHRPYQPFYPRGQWRRWSAFGTGVIGDWTCHIIDPVFWALDLGAPATIHAETGDFDPDKHCETFPPAPILTYTFPARGERPPVTLKWFGGASRPPRPAELEEDRNVPDMGAVVYGDNGAMMYGSHGASDCRIFPETKMQEYKRPEKTLPRAGNHHRDWINAIREGRKAGSDFSYGAPLTEIALLGALAMRYKDLTLEWDSANMRVTNCADADQWLKKPMREGWTL